MRAAVLLLLAGCLRPLSAQTELHHGLSPSVYRLARIRVKMEENLRRLPNYTCVQTIERSRRLARSRRFQLVDTVRLEVALVNGKELFSWPGAGKFEEKELRDLVGGTIGNGNFALHAKAVFFSNTATFEHGGEFEEKGRKMVRYRYSVPRFRSGYTLRVGETRGIAGYNGFFDADAATDDLIRLEVNAIEIPPDVPLTSARDRMEYARLSIGGGEFLLPHSSELVMVDLTGTESRNRVHLSACRQYSGESVISFADAPAESDAPPPPPPPLPLALPDGLSLDVRLERAVEADKAAVGDPVSGTLVSEARLRRTAFLPRGAKVTGRVREIKRLGASMAGMALELNHADFPGGTAEFRAVPSDYASAGLPGQRTAIDKQGIIYISGSRRGLAAGARLYWRVESRPDRKSK